MAKHKRKPAPAKPITTHQLFPAVVALWFGALFGLGSLAVRPSLLESLVIKSRIDLLVPAAAPPLGVTARILVALVLAAIGAGIGIAIARRLARPKQEHHERKRGAGSIAEASDRLRSSNHYADAAVRQPLSVNDDLGSDASASTLAPRRRSLAIAHEEVDFVPHDMAPLPGSVPQILDIGEVRISPEAAEAPFDLNGYSAQTEPQQYAPPPASPVQLDWNNAAPVQSAPGAEPQPPRDAFQQTDHAADQQDLAHEAAAAAADGRQVFGLTPPVQPYESPRQIFGQSVTDDHVDPEFVRAAGFKTTVFETETPSSLFPLRDTGAIPANPAQEYSVPPAPEIQPYQVPEAYVPPSQLVPSASDTSASLYAAPVATEPTLPSPAGLGMDDLASRLAESMARRRAARTGQIVDAPVAAVIAPSPVAFEAAAPLIPAAYEAPPTAPMPQFESLASAPPPQAFIPQFGAEPIAAPQQFAAPEPAFAPAPAVLSPDQSIPQAMRPLDLGGFEEDDAPLDSVLQPRMIAMPAVLAAVPVAEIPAPFAAPADEAEIANEGVAEESYGSLLAVAPAAPVRTGFVRIEEPEAETAATEPVVIFPGQMARPSPPMADQDSGSFRRFDAPASAGQGQPIAANQALSEVDSAEAQRALRSALANLQRMSGAA